MTKSVFISRDLEESSEFATRLRAGGWQVRGFSLVTLTPLKIMEIPEAEWIFFASKNAVRFFFEGLGWKTGDDPVAGLANPDRGLANPTPDPSPKGEGRRGADTHDATVHSTSPSLEVRNPTPDPSPKGEGRRGADTHDATVHSTSPLPFRGGDGGEVSPFRGGDGVSQARDEPSQENTAHPKKASVYSTDSAQWKYLKSFAREMRKQPTEAEEFMWKVLRGRRFEGLKFRRQHAIDDFIVDFVNLDLHLIIEIDGSIHDIQPEYDKLRTEWLTVLGYKLIRFTNEQVLKNLPLVKRRLKEEVKLLRELIDSTRANTDPGLANPTPNPSPEGRNPTPDPSPKGEGRRGADTHDATVHSTSPLPFRGGDGGGVSPFRGGDGGGVSPFRGGDGGEVSPFRGGDGGEVSPFSGGVGGGVSPFRDGGGVLWAALGPATARELLRYTHRVDFAGTGDPDGTATAFLSLARGKRVLFPAARHSQQSIARILGDAIMAVHLAVYDNAPLSDPPLLDESILVFTSPMNARAYFARHSIQTHQRVVAIGQTTASALRALGIKNAVMSKEPAEAALADTVLAMVEK